MENQCFNKVLSILRRTPMTVCDLYALTDFSQHSIDLAVEKLKRYKLIRRMTMAEKEGAVGFPNLEYLTGITTQ